MPLGEVKNDRGSLFWGSSRYRNQRVKFYRRYYMYAIIATGGKQYKVSEGDVIRIEKLGVEEGEKVSFDNVLAVSDGKLLVGEDVANSSVEATVVKNGRDKKIIVYKYKRKSGYHKKQGHRQAYTEVKIDSIKA